MTYRKLLRFGLALCLLAHHVSSLACINEYEGTGKFRDQPPPNSSVLDLELGPDIRKNLRTSCEERMMSNVTNKKNITFAQLSDQGACEIYRGNYAEAIRLLQKAESLSSGEYIIAANLGTAYELAGDIALAAKWIGIGIDRNPGAHAGTEWLHLDILKSKQALLTAPDWLSIHPVLGKQSPRDRVSDNLSSESYINDNKALLALTYQLKERLQFVSPPDPVVADLLLDYGILAARYRTLGEGKHLFDLAAKYGAPRAEIAKHLRYAQGRVDAYQAEQQRANWVGAAIVALLVAVVLASIVWLLGRVRRVPVYLTPRSGAARGRRPAP